MKRKLLIASVLVLSILAIFSFGPDAPGQAAQEPPVEATGAAGEPLAGEPLETFEPTEKLPADTAISFPVDI